MRTLSPARAAPLLAAAVVATAALAASVLAEHAAPSALAAPQQTPPAAPPAPSDKVPIETFFHGKLTKVEVTPASGAKPEVASVEILYDFSDAGQLADFEASCPFRAIRTIEYEVKNGKLLVQGTGSMRHHAVFDGEIGASAVLVPRRPRDFGFAVSEERESEVFTLYCCYDKYFSAGDNVHIPQNMIIKFLARDPKVNANGLQDWRYCGSRGQSPEIVSGKPYQVSLARTGMQSRMSIEGNDDHWESKGKEAGRDITSMMVALYGYDTQFEADDLVVRGKLDPQWVAKHKIDVNSWKPPAPDPSKGAEAPAGPVLTDTETERVRSKIAGYPLDTKPAALAAMLRDVAIPVALRTEAAEKAKAIGAKNIVPFLVDGLYSADADARRLSFDVLKTVSGKSFNFRPDGPEEGRKKAIRELNDYLQKHADEFA